MSEDLLNTKYKDKLEPSYKVVTQFFDLQTYGFDLLYGIDA